MLELLRALAGAAGHRSAHRERPAAETLQALARRPPDLAPRRARLSLARSGDREWVPAAELGGSWREPVLAMLRETTQRTPGSLVEVKTAALAWHYRMADQETGARRANELRLHLNQLLSNQPVEILAGQPGDRDPAVRHPQGPHRARRSAPSDWRPPPSWPSAMTAPTRISSTRCRPRPSPSGSARGRPGRASASTEWPRCGSCCRRWWRRGWGQGGGRGELSGTLSPSQRSAPAPQAREPHCPTRTAALSSRAHRGIYPAGSELGAAVRIGGQDLGCARDDSFLP